MPRSIGTESLKRKILRWLNCIALGIGLPNWSLSSEHNISNTATVGGTEKPGLIFRDGVPIQLHALSLLQKTVQIRDQFFLYMDPGQELQS